MKTFTNGAKGATHIPTLEELLKLKKELALDYKAIFEGVRVIPSHLLPANEYIIMCGVGVWEELKKLEVPEPEKGTL